MDERPTIGSPVRLGPTAGIVVSHGVGLTDHVWVRFGAAEIPVRILVRLLTPGDAHVRS